MEKPKNVAIAGGGIIGLSIGFQLLRKGISVTVFDKGIAGEDTSRVGGGMIAPNAEASFEEHELLKMNRKSLEQFPKMLKEIKDYSSEEVPLLHNRSSLLVAVDSDDARILKRLYAFRQQAELEVTFLSGTEAREKEPLLSPRIISALLLPEDCEINNISLIRALKSAFVNKKGKLKENEPVSQIIISSGKMKGIVTEKDKYSFDHVVVAAGSYSTQIQGIPDDILPSIRPVKGQIITLLENDECRLNLMIRTPRIYLVPKDDGRLLLGATSEEKGFDTTITAGAIWYLLDEGRKTVPAIHELPIRQSDAGLRPATPDNKPVIGVSKKVPEISIATGFFRHGFLLAPLAGYALSEAIVSGEQSALPACFLPERFN